MEKNPPIFWYTAFIDFSHKLPYLGYSSFRRPKSGHRTVLHPRIWMQNRFSESINYIALCSAWLSVTRLKHGFILQSGIRGFLLIIHQVFSLDVKHVNCVGSLSSHHQPVVLHLIISHGKGTHQD